MTFRLRPAVLEDAPMLARMNHALLEDEGSRNPMDVDELTRRMRRMLGETWRAVVFESGGAPVGYMLYRITTDDYDPERPEVFVGQFFIERERRREGMGREAFEQSVADYFPVGSRITLEVLETNPGGHSFWRRLGFEPYCTQYSRNDETS